MDLSLSVTRKMKRLLTYTLAHLSAMSKLSAFWNARKNNLLEVSVIKLNAISDIQPDTLRKWRNHPGIMQWTRQNQPLTIWEHEKWYYGLQSRDDVKMYGIFNESDTPVGVCGLTDIDHVNSRAEFSLYIEPHSQGNGYGKAALIELLRVGFQVLNLNMIWGESFHGNPAQEMFKSVGFTQTGYRPAFYYRNGEYVNACLWAIGKDYYGFKYCNPTVDDNQLDLVDSVDTTESDQTVRVTANQKAAPSAHSYPFGAGKI